MATFKHSAKLVLLTGGIFLLLATAFDAFWWTMERLDPFSHQEARSGTVPSIDTAGLAPQGQTTATNFPGRLTLELCDAANFHPTGDPPVSASIERIIDGDTLDAFVGGNLYRFRLWGIDAPERDQPTGLQSAERLALLVPPETTTTFYPVALDPYDRVLIVAGNPTQPAINFQMVMTGMAYQSTWPDAQANRCLTEATRLALHHETGVWSTNPNGGIRPWDHRKTH